MPQVIFYIWRIPAPFDITNKSDVLWHLRSVYCCCCCLWCCWCCCYPFKTSPICKFFGRTTKDGLILNGSNEKTNNKRSCRLESNLIKYVMSRKHTHINTHIHMHTLTHPTFIRYMYSNNNLKYVYYCYC